MNHYDSSREMRAGQRVTVHFDAEVTHVPEPMDYSDTVTVREPQAGLLLQIPARDVIRATSARFFLARDGSGDEGLWMETERPGFPAHILSEVDRDIRNHPGAWEFIRTALAIAAGPTDNERPAKDGKR